MKQAIKQFLGNSDIEDAAEVIVAGLIIIMFFVFRAFEMIGSDPFLEALLFIAVAAIFGSSAVKSLK